MVGDGLRIDGRAGLKGCIGVFSLFILLVLTGFAGKAEAAPETIAEYGMDSGEVRSPQGAAVEMPGGDLFISEGNNFRVSKFDSEGSFLLAFGYGVADGTPVLQTCGPEATPPTTHCLQGLLMFAPSSVAVDQSGDVYVSEQRRVLKFTSSGHLIFMVGKDVNQTKVAEAGATQAEKDLCTAASGDSCGSAENGTGANEFSGFSMPLAVDSAGVVWVGDYERIASFDSSGAPGVEFVLAGAGDTKSLALDSSGNFYVRSESLAGVRKLEAGTGALIETLDAAGQPRPVALDEDDNVYIGDATSPYRFKVYNPAGEQVAQFGTGEVIGAPGEGFFGTNAIAVDAAAGKLYSASSSPTESESVVQAFPLPDPGPLPENEHVENLLPSTVTLAADLNPEGDQTTYHFEYDTTPYGENGGGHGTLVPVPDATLAGEEFETEAVAAELEELIPSTTYHFRLCATNSAATVCGSDASFTTPPAILIDPEWVSNLSAHSVTLSAELNPLGVEAEAWLEYGVNGSFGQVVPLANLGEGFDLVLRQATLTGLQAATTYHYRFSARDTRDGHVYTVHGADRTFTTQFGGLGFQLADQRVWEMVSPPDKHGGILGSAAEVISIVQAGADGDGLAYQSYGSIEADPEGNRILEPSMNLARRQADGSWRSKDITSPNETVTPIAGGESEFKLFNPDLSEALLDPRSGTPLSPEAPNKRTPYLRENSEPAVYTPLLTDANLPPGTEFGDPEEVGRAVKVIAATPDLRHVGLYSDVPLVEGAPEGAPYEWSGGQIKPVSVLPAGEGGAIVTARHIGSGPAMVRGAISEDGYRVFWSPGTNFSEISALYVRDTQAGESGRLDLKEAGATGFGTANPVFQGASADGRVVFFTDFQQLTEDASPTGADLYRCELPAGSVASGCATLTNLSIPAGAHKSAQVQGLAPALTDDGSTIYFVAKGILDTRPNAFGDSAVSGQPNLYLWQQGEGVRFIATLADEDRTDWGQNSASSSESFATALTATASPSGRYLAFMSQRSLTGYDNRDESSGGAAPEVFRYDSAAEQLDCVSCNPSGARPRSAEPSQAFGGLVDPWNLWAGQLVAASLPEATRTGTGNVGVSLYRSRAVLDSGRVFFNAIDPLVPSDSNGQWDVYQYEPLGVGDCSSSSGGASSSHLGEACVSLLSSGTAEEEAAFLDADETGNNAFIFTPAQLSVLDEDHELDVYDARVDGIAAKRPVNPECLGEACQPAAPATNDLTPASSAFNGAGNVKPARKRCPRGKRLVHRKGKARCVRHKRPHRKVRRAHRHRRAHR